MFKTCTLTVCRNCSNY